MYLPCIYCSVLLLLSVASIGASPISTVWLRSRLLISINISPSIPTLCHFCLSMHERSPNGIPLPHILSKEHSTNVLLLRIACYKNLIQNNTFSFRGLFLPPANVVCEGYVFTGVCLSTRGGGSPSGGFSIKGGFSIWGGSPSGGSPSGGSPSGGVLHIGGVLHPGGLLNPVNVRAVRILLECILVCFKVLVKLLK